jgi:hypothetical protein
MKTAMQELIDELESIKGYKYGGLVIRLIKDKLEKEKLQIELAHTTGYNDCYKYQKGLTKLVTPRGATEYYNETYNQNQ